MRPHLPASRSRTLAATAVATVAAVAAIGLGGCGEVTNTIHPSPVTANQVTLVLAGPPNAFYIGIYEAETLGYFRQTNIDLHIVVPKAGQNSVDMVHYGHALIGVSSEPTIFLHRNALQPVVGVAALVHGPLSDITVPVPRPGPSGGNAVTTGAATSTTTTPTATTASRATHTSTTATGTGTTPAPTTTTYSEQDSTLWPSQLHELLSKPGHPTYDGMVLLVRKRTIVEHAGLPRRFVQAVARGYRAARANPTGAIANLVKEVPALASQKALQLSILEAAMPHFFPPGAQIWGWQREAEWNYFGTWMMQHHLINNPNAITDASTNELLQGEGI